MMATSLCTIDILLLINYGCQNDAILGTHLLSHISINLRNYTTSVMLNITNKILH